MNVRQLDRADAPAYQALRLEALRESPTAFSASYEDEIGRSLEEVAARITPAADGSLRMFGIFEGADLCGFVAIVHPQRAKLRHSVELAGMYVAPVSRRRGLASALLQEVIRDVRSMAGIRRIKLGVNAGNAAAIALYRSAGFERYGIEPDALNVDGRFYDEEHFVLRLPALGSVPP
jgi:ribosomal protein S18 acetylase RimI-like enzyme